jgi:nicotinate phosphoribosyltransferase
VIGAASSAATPAEALAQARAHHERARTALPPEGWALSRGEPALETVSA